LVYTGGDDYRIPFVGLIGWVSLFTATVATALVGRQSGRR
jgi:hypothetical protein